MTLRHLLPYFHSAIITNARRDLKDHKSTLPIWYMRKLRPRDLLKVTRWISDRARTRTQNFLTILFCLSYWQNVEWMCDWRLIKRRTGLSVCLHRDIEDSPTWEPNFAMVPQKSCSLSIVLAFISAVLFLWNALPSLAFKVLYKVQCNATFPVRLPSYIIWVSFLCFHNALYVLLLYVPATIWWDTNLLYLSFPLVSSPLNRQGNQISEMNPEFEPPFPDWEGDAGKPAFLVLVIN